MQMCFIYSNQFTVFGFALLFQYAALELNMRLFQTHIVGLTYCAMNYLWNSNGTSEPALKPC
jgi:hypothetical protein